jgi:tRNA (guanosine-2'-O-)-methyltransferase
MRRVGAPDGDIFRPRGQLARELELARESPEEVVRALVGRISPKRRERIERVLASRCRSLAVAVEGVRDPHNAAAVIRTAEAFGLTELHIVETEDRFLSSRKVTQGSHKWIDLVTWRSPEGFLQCARAEGRRVLVAAADGESDLREIARDRPAVLVFGNEVEGVSPRMRELADSSFSIPMHGFVESLNVSVAAAISLFVLRADGRGDLSPEEQAVLRARYYLRAVRRGYDIAVVAREEKK